MTDRVISDGTQAELVYSCSRSYEDGGSLCYKLYKRRNIDADLDAVWLYDFCIIKMHGRDIVGSGNIKAVSSIYERARALAETAEKWQITPLLIYDFYEEYQSV